jgi:hypothetical protein
VIILDERHEVHVVLAPDDEDALAGVAVWVWSSPASVIVMR